VRDDPNNGCEGDQEGPNENDFQACASWLQLAQRPSLKNYFVSTLNMYRTISSNF